MPIYEFECQSCGHIAEKLLKISESFPVECDICHKGPLEKLMSQSSFILKGGGWYASDFKRKSPTTTGPIPSVADAEASNAADKAASAKPEAPKVSPPPSKSE